jgi:hypothetical protein
VAIRPGDDPDRRRAAQAVALDVPAGRGEEVVPRRRQAGEVGHLAAGDDPEGGVLRQAEQVLEPASRHLLDDARGRRRQQEARVLVPDGRQPVGCDPRREGAAHDEAEEPTAPDGHQARVGVAGELLDDGESVGGRLGQRAAERRPQLLDRRLRPHRPLVQRLEEIGRDVGRSLQEVARAHARVNLLHAATLTP